MGDFSQAGPMDLAEYVVGPGDPEGKGMGRAVYTTLYTKVAYVFFQARETIMRPGCPAGGSPDLE